MIIGILLIICGMLIAFYPPLLSLIVAVLLIFAGSIILTFSYRYKKTARKVEDPFVDFFMRL
jgi:uncharacterized membrane protein HdeD (DUF308 family)